MGVTVDRLLRPTVVVAHGTAYSLNALRVVTRLEARATPIHVRWHDGTWEAATCNRRVRRERYVSGIGVHTIGAIVRGWSNDD